jgi:hypothetical protein
MNKEGFVKVLKTVVHDSAISSTIAAMGNPPGRKPSLRTKGLSEWYLSLDEANRKMVELAVKRSVHSAVFQWLAVLDGVTAIEDCMDKGELRLFFEKKGKRILLNDNERGEFLHDLYQGLVQDDVL